MVANKSPDGMTGKTTGSQWTDHLAFRGLSFLIQALKFFRGYGLQTIVQVESGQKASSTCYGKRHYFTAGMYLFYMTLN